MAFVFGTSGMRGITEAAIVQFAVQRLWSRSRQSREDSKVARSVAVVLIEPRDFANHDVTDKSPCSTDEASVLRNAVQATFVGHVNHAFHTKSLYLTRPKVRRFRTGRRQPSGSSREG